MNRCGRISLLGVASCALALLAGGRDAGPDFQSRFLAVGLSGAVPSFRYFAVDSLGQGRLEGNPVLSSEEALSSLRLTAGSRGRYRYIRRTADGRERTAWSIACSDRMLTLRSDFVESAASLPFVLAFNQKANHATLLGFMAPGERRVVLPCVLHLPDRGSVRITGSAAGLGLEYDARRYVKEPYVRIAFPAATAERTRVEYKLEVAAIHPRLPGRERDSLFDGFRRSFLNIFQVNPRVQMLANNASSDPVPFTLYKLADMAVAAPPLAGGLTCLDLVRMTLDRYLDGTKGYGIVGYGVEPGDADLVAWKGPWNSLDSFPSLLIAACVYFDATQDVSWFKAHYHALLGWARAMLSADKDGNGLIEYPGTGNSGDRATAERRPANWWDTINFGHEDAYSNSLAYRACRLMARAARRLGREAEAAFLTSKADTLRAAFRPAFWNPETGVLAGWRSADGKLHDYWFTFVNGAAISFGLVDREDAEAIMDRILGKMDEVGYSAFRHGLPGNLVPVRKADYVVHNWDGARAIGEPFLEDGTDAFEIYENGGATACFAYFTLKALYTLGRVREARRILYPMLESFAAGDFQGFCDNGKSKDWRDWSGGCHGYEGLLVDGYLALLAVLDDLGGPRPGR